MSLTVGSSGSVYQILSLMNNLDVEQSRTMARIASGKRINRASDDPAGLVALSSLNSSLAGVNAALDNNQRSQDMLNVADGALTEISSLVAQVQELVVKGSAAGVSTSEKSAYQAQIDESVDAIDRLVNTTSFNGKSIFNGENRIAAITNSTASVKNLTVYRRNPNNAATQTLTVNVTAAATRGSAVTTATTAAALSAATTIQITGKLGTATISLSNGTTGVNIMAAVVAQKSITGVSAAAQGVNIAFMSSTTGSDAFVSVQTLDGSKTFSNTATVTKTSGVDARVRVNGEQANAVGTEVFYTGGGVSLSFNLAKNVVNAGLTVSVMAGGGATFQLGDSSTTQTTLGLGGLTSYELGRSDIGSLSDLRSGGSQSIFVSGNNAGLIAQEAVERVSMQAGRVGAFNKYQIGSSINILNANKEGLASAIETIGSTDYAEETAKLQRQQTLMSAAISMLGLANSQQSNVLALLR
jgi:flagellin